MLIGYARVSTQDQNLDLQIDALTKAGCKKLFNDKISGSGKERPGLTKDVYKRQGWRGPVDRIASRCNRRSK